MENGPKLKLGPEYSNLKHLKGLRKYSNKSLGQLGSDSLYTTLGVILMSERIPGHSSEMTVGVLSLTYCFFFQGRGREGEEI